MVEMGLEVISATAQAIVDNAERLGLTWTLRPATVTTPTQTVATAFVSARYDGDVASINMVNMTEAPLETGTRVYAIRVPPSGNFIVGTADPSPLGMAVYNNVVDGDPASGSTTSATFTDMPGPMEFTVYKKYDATQLLLGMSGSWFQGSAEAGTGAAFGIEIAGASYGDDDYNMSAYQATLPVGAVRLPIIHSERLVEVGRGLLTLTARWYRVSGAGTLNVLIAQDFLYMKAQEVWV